ncbi:AAA family ATPase [Reichenbachiella sp. MALMAid0571]|uniref:AAA family ATPase n=1 Tax=Reichenbachiella sp. MALMAid0571 TaxID=3143939 RepID=UPI0032DECAA3
MKILNLTYQDNALKWSLKSANFDNLTLLVGASGVGKTQILKSIMRLKSIADGKSISGIKWNIVFETLSGQKFEWDGEFENKGDIDFSDDDDDDLKRNKPSIVSENLKIDGNIIVIRNKDSIIFNNAKTVKLPNQQSIIHLLKEEDLIKPAFEGFGKIIYSDQTDSTGEAYRIKFSDTQKLLKTNKSLKSIQESKEDIRIKLFLAYKNTPKTFATIKERYIDIFPQVEDVKVEPMDYEDEDNIPFFFKEYPFIQIKEFGVDKWIKQGNISSGMFISLMHISEIYLCSEGSVFLIDEFENSLGINCINELTNDILSSQRQIQFILTSHHPYIINNIGYSNWKLVTRTKGVVNTHNPDEYKIGKSKHDAFMQLIQLDQYQTGLE